MATVEPQTKHWTLDEYHRLGDAGVFIDQRVELIDGEILTMSPMKAAHAAATELTAAALRGSFGPGLWIRVQLPLAISDNSEPEPDLAVVPGAPRDYPEHPASALLVVEVSDTTLAFDRGKKRRLYAAAGVADYWVLNLIDEQLEVYRDPIDGDFQNAATFGPDADISPLAAPDARISVRELLP
ncbi:MAG: Uma2 family endonuclease [Planctomycetota bacterium]|nr:Uma2 family endonuclease [Planctomycetota bacterium]